MRFRETERGQRAQIGDLESGRITSASPTGRPAGRQADGGIGARFICLGARVLSRKGQTAPVLSSHWAGGDAARYSSDFRADEFWLCCDRRPRLLWPPGCGADQPGALCGCDLVIAPHHPRAPRRPRRYPARLAMSSGVSRRLAAATFSSRWARLPVPGMGSITGEAASSAAGATCWTVACAGRRSSRAGSCRWDRGRRRAGRTARTRCRTRCTPPAARRPRWRPRGMRSAPRRPGRSRGPRRVARRRRC